MGLAQEGDVLCSGFQQQFSCCLSLFPCTRTAASFVYHVPLFHKALPRSCCPLRSTSVDRNLLGAIPWSLCFKDISGALLLGVSFSSNTNGACPCLQSICCIILQELRFGAFLS